jgi:hypothetical protein
MPLAILYIKMMATSADNSQFSTSTDASSKPILTAYLDPSEHPDSLSIPAPFKIKLFLLNLHLATLVHSQFNKAPAVTIDSDSYQTGKQTCYYAIQLSTMSTCTYLNLLAA